MRWNPRIISLPSRGGLAAFPLAASIAQGWASDLTVTDSISSDRCGSYSEGARHEDLFHHSSCMRDHGRMYGDQSICQPVRLCLPDRSNLHTSAAAFEIRSALRRANTGFLRFHATSHLWERFLIRRTGGPDHGSDARTAMRVKTIASHCAMVVVHVEGNWAARLTCRS